ncbi:MAG: sigma-70 family RNA polymerase sigma factor [Opitutaceae bacterium]
MPTDAELLQRYVDQRDESAFEAIVSRYLGLVHGSACRRLGARSHLAEDVCQRVFTALARRAPGLIHHPALAAWLHRCTRNLSLETLRKEHRVEKLAQSVTSMSDPSTPPEPSIDWERVRPLLDEAIDRLPESDREIVLLRYFGGLSFAEVGERLRLKENTARMRATRALDRLRDNLATRGVDSSAAALATLLASPVLTAAPSGLAVSVAAGAIAQVPSGFAAGAATFFMTSKIVGPLVSAGLAAALTAVVWQAVPQTVSSAELSMLRTENERINRIVRVETLPERARVVAQAAAAHRAARSASAPERSLPAAAAEPAAGAKSPSGAARSIRGHTFHGQDTAANAGMSFAYASDATDVDLLAKLIWFDPELRQRAAAMLATYPESIRAAYPTPEQFYALVIAADALIYPPPGPDTFANFTAVELSPGRVAMRRKGSDRNFHEYQLTPEGWKFVMPAVGVERWPNNLNNELLVRLSRQP